MTLEAPLLQQNGTYAASELRKLVVAALPGVGVLDDGDLKVTQRGAGANMSVDVAAGSVSIQSGTSSRGRYLCRSTATANVSITAAPGAGTSRIDLLVCSVLDTEYSEASDTWSLSVVTGTPASSPVAPTAPAGSQTLASITVPSGVSSVTNSMISDVRQYARSVTYTDRLPFYAVNGQVVVDSTGVVSTRSAGGWSPLPHVSQFEVQKATIAPTTMSSVLTAIKTLTFGTPVGPVNVVGSFLGNVIASGSNHWAEVRVDVSFNGGSTWTTGALNWALSPDGLSPVGFSAGAAETGTPTGAVKVRVMAHHTSGNGDVAGMVVAHLTPA